MNQNNSTAGFLATHVDLELTKGLKGLDDDAMATRIEAIIDLFKLLHGRDAFIKYAEAKLAYRLLNNTSISDFFEEELLH